jgi:hypothetical protein
MDSTHNKTSPDDHLVKKMINQTFQNDESHKLQCYRF